MLSKDNAVYLDNNATTRVDERVLDHMKKFYTEDYAIASSEFSHSMGIKSKDAVEMARNTIADTLHSNSDEIVFTSGGTESNNLALWGLKDANEDPGRKKIIISPVEHFSVLHTAEALRRKGMEIVFCRVNEQGFVDIDHLSDIIDDECLLVSIIHANHEVGTIQDIKTIAEIAHRRGAYFHSDASVSYGYCNIDTRSIGCDLLTLTSHKIYGPKGAGALFVKKGTKINKMIYGGYSEYNLRSGTQNVPCIAGFGKAVELLGPQDIDIARSNRDYLYHKIFKEIDLVHLNGAEDFSRRLANNLNLSFDFIEGESIVLHLDLNGISVVTGSSCFSRNLQASHVLMAMGFTHERAHSSIRFSTSKYLDHDKMDYTVNILKETVENLRKLSPLSK